MSAEVDLDYVRCICGHWRNAHQHKVGCCRVVIAWGDCECACDEYQIDNLEYLKEKYEQKNKV